MLTSPRWVRLARSLVASTPVRVAQAAGLGLSAGIALARSGEARIISLPASPPTARAALLSYAIAPFVGRGRAPGTDPTAAWVSLTLARLLRERGWNVDVVSDANVAFVPARPYGVVIASRRSLSRLAPRLPAECIKVLYLDGPDVLVQHAAECDRLLDLKDRRRVVLSPVRFERPTPALEQAACAIVQGNALTLDGYRHARIPLHRVATVATGEQPPPRAKDFEACRRSFVAPGTRGLVHQGLDRTLEAFAALPDHRVTVYAPVHRERQFQEAYRHELRETPNIHTARWHGLGHQRFGELAQKAVGLVFPSSAEGQAQEVIAGMAAGLIPIVTREAGVDVDGFGVVLSSSSPAEVSKAVRDLSALPVARLGEMAEGAWRCARSRHAPDAVARRLDEILNEVLTDSPAAR
jgi:glycosyltransferase involved in cell wall biosynthesis